MKKIFFNIILLFSLMSCKTNKDGFIEFRHVGPCDKYIQTLRIVKKDIPSDILTEVVKVNDKTFYYLFKYLTDGRKKGKCINKVYDKYGSYQITVSTDTTINFCYDIDSRIQSLAFFRGVAEYLKKNNLDKNLQKEIQTVIIHRIDHLAPGFPEK